MTFESQNSNNNEFYPNNKIIEYCNTIIDYSQKKYPRYDLSHFAGYFTDDEIEQDNNRIEHIKNNFLKKNSSLGLENQKIIDYSKMKGEALEVIIADQIENSDWFGDESLFFRTTEYDDFINGVDAVVEFNIEESNHPERISLSIDSTSCTGSEIIKNKIDRNISKILNNKLEVKYYESPVLDADQAYTGSLKDIVPVVIGLESSNTSHLVASFSRFIQLESLVNDTKLSNNLRVTYRKEFNSLRREIEKDPCQLVFLKEIKYQLEMYSRILTKENNPNINVKVSDVNKITKIINNILEEKNEIEKSFEVSILRKNDAVYNLIGYHCNSRTVTSN